MTSLRILHGALQLPQSCPSVVFNGIVIPYLSIVKLIVQYFSAQYSCIFKSFLPLGTQTLNLTTTLENVNERYLAYPLQRVYFICTTIGSNIQEWHSSEYITGIDDRIQLHEGRRSGRGRAVNAMIISITTNSAGETVIVSQLILTVSTQYPVVTISCGNDRHGMREDITFNITGMLM